MKKIFVSLMALSLASMPICDCSALDNAEQMDDATTSQVCDAELTCDLSALDNAEQMDDATTSQVCDAEPTNATAEKSNEVSARKHGKKVAAIGAAATAVAAVGYGAYKHYLNGATANVVETGNNNSAADVGGADMNNSTEAVPANDEGVCPVDDEERSVMNNVLGALKSGCAASANFLYDYIWTPLKDSFTEDPAKASVGTVVAAAGLTNEYQQWQLSKRVDGEIIEVTDIPTDITDEYYYTLSNVRYGIDGTGRRLLQSLTRTTPVDELELVGQFFDSVNNDDVLILPEPDVEPEFKVSDEVYDKISDTVDQVTTHTSVLETITIPSLAGAKAIFKSKRSLRNAAMTVANAVAVICGGMFMFGLV